MTDLRYKPKTYKILWAGASVLAVAFLGSLVVLEGPQALNRPLPFGPDVSRYVLTFNGLFCLLVGLLILKNLMNFQEKWNWQERMTYRGTVILLGGAVLANLSRAFREDANLSIGTLPITVGILVMAYGVLSPPQRFEGSSKDPIE